MALFLEVNIGVPRGPVPFMSETWQDNFVHAVRTADQLGLEIILGTGPGWAGAGGPWIEPANSMQHLRASSVQATGPARFTGILPVPEPRAPSAFAGLSPKLAQERQKWHADVAVLAFPTPAKSEAPDLLDVKALYETQPYSIWKHVPRSILSKTDYPDVPAGAAINPTGVLDLTSRLRPDGSLDWNVPRGSWTVMRFAARSTGSTTRPAPEAGHGFETDRFSAEAFAKQFEQFHQKLLDKVGPRRPGSGWTGLHLDSWESSSQNWSANFRKEFNTRRGYDPQPYFPAYAGLIVGSREITERFLWDLRKTAQELVIANHAMAIKRHAHERGLYYSNQPYDMNPAGNIELGAAADIPSCEFWSAGPDTVYSCVEAVSIAHTMGRPVVRAEAFTSPGKSGYQHNPADMKKQTDWAFALGINDLIFHNYQHQPLGLDGPKPGMAMGPYGVHWHRNQTFWSMVAPYHDYIARCGQMLRQGVAVADILYLTPEGAPDIFLPPPDAMFGTGLLREKKGDGFDAVSPGILMARATAEGGKIVFPGGTSYRALVLPVCGTMTPELLATIEKLVRDGITVIGAPPVKSPSLAGYPQCDETVTAMAQKIWGGGMVPPQPTERNYGKGRIIWGGSATPVDESAARDLIHQHSRWIWSPDDASPKVAGGVTRYFQKSITVDPQRKVKKARVQITADNEYEVWVNGKRVAGGNDFNVISALDIDLKPGANVLAVSVANTGAAPNPAGLIAVVQLHFEDGGTQVLGSGATWRVAQQAEDGWQRETKTGANWKECQLLGPASMKPWKLSAGPAPSVNYPTFESTVALLRKWGVAPAFETTGPVRCHQRRTADFDIFFVANREAQPIEAVCTFRTDGTAPELWDPVTGGRSPLPEYRNSPDASFDAAQGRRTEVPLHFAPQQSWFVVFNRGLAPTPPAKDAKDALNFPAPKLVRELTGPWTVQFDPKWGGPKEPVAFDTLSLWNAHAIEGIRYYSGEATYRKIFDYSVPGVAASRLFLDLGVVHKLARVKLNGEDLGIVWTPPFRVEITGKLRASGNVLDVTVVNTWVNRLVGDQQPANKAVRQLEWKSGLLAGRSFAAGSYTFTTVADYSAASPLQESGLLGPVSILMEGPQAISKD